MAKENYTMMHLGLSSFDSFRRFGRKVKQSGQSLDVLVCNILAYKLSLDDLKQSTFGLKVPINIVVTNEGGSGYALATGCVNRMFVLENVAFYVARSTFGLKVPINIVVTNEGGSGYALATGCVNRMFVLENVAFYVASETDAAYNSVG
ncbi:acetyl-coenzyme A carboxylase carboxyl transferase subunit alpha, chloroplastic-like protein [Tanacetum coccineum]